VSPTTHGAQKKGMPSFSKELGMRPRVPKFLELPDMEINNGAILAAAMELPQ
tara:strand:+ start:820 stop:975 length:156 start_codon:yes stop_codon:yes gene_type:complete